MIVFFAGAGLIFRKLQSPQKMKALHWFRKGLRLHDNPALYHAIEKAGVVYPVFILDPWFLHPDKVGLNRIRFLLQSLRDLDRSLRSKGSQLIVLEGKAPEVLQRAVETWKIEILTYEWDGEPYSLRRDGEVEDCMREKGVEVVSFASHSVWDPREVTSKCDRVPTSLSGLR